MKEQRERLAEIYYNIEIEYLDYLTKIAERAIDGDIEDKIQHRQDFYVDKLLANGVIVPSCKVGQTVYRIVEMSTGITSKIRAIRREAKTTGAIIPCEPTIKRFIRCVTVTKNNLIDCCENYGKTVFLTKEEAEQALRKEDKGK